MTDRIADASADPRVVTRYDVMLEKILGRLDAMDAAQVLRDRAHVAERAADEAARGLAAAGLLHRVEVLNGATERSELERAKFAQADVVFEQVKAIGTQITTLSDKIDQRFSIIDQRFRDEGAANDDRFHEVAAEVAKLREGSADSSGRRAAYAALLAAAGTILAIVAFVTSR